MANVGFGIEGVATPKPPQTSFPVQQSNLAYGAISAPQEVTPEVTNYIRDYMGKSGYNNTDVALYLYYHGLELAKSNPLSNADYSQGIQLITGVNPNDLKAAVSKLTPEQVSYYQNYNRFDSVWSNGYNDYVLKYGKGNVVKSYTGSILGGMIPALKTIRPDVDVDDISGAEWLLSAAQVLSLVSLGTGTTGILAKVVGYGAQASYGAWTAIEWGRMTPTEKAVSLAILAMPQVIPAITKATIKAGRMVGNFEITPAMTETIQYEAQAAKAIKELMPDALPAYTKAISAQHAYAEALATIQENERLMSMVGDDVLRSSIQAQTDSLRLNIDGIRATAYSATEDYAKYVSSNLTRLGGGESEGLSGLKDARSAFMHLSDDALKNIEQTVSNYYTPASVDELLENIKTIEERIAFKKFEGTPYTDELERIAYYRTQIALVKSGGVVNKYSQFIAKRAELDQAQFELTAAYVKYGKDYKAIAEYREIIENARSKVGRLQGELAVLDDETANAINSMYIVEKGTADDVVGELMSGGGKTSTKPIETPPTATPPSVSTPAPTIIPVVPPSATPQIITGAPSAPTGLPANYTEVYPYSGVYWDNVAGHPPMDMYGRVITAAQANTMLQAAINAPKSTGIATPVGTIAPVGWEWRNGEWYNEYGQFVGVDTDFPYITPNTPPIEVPTKAPIEVATPPETIIETGVPSGFQTNEPDTPATPAIPQMPQPSTPPQVATPDGVVNPDAATGFQVESNPPYFVVYPQPARTKPKQKPKEKPITEIITPVTPIEPVDIPTPVEVFKPVMAYGIETGVATGISTGTSSGTESSTQTQTKTQTKTSTTTATTTQNEDKSKSKKTIILPNGKEIELTPEQKRGAIAWKQGIMFKLWLPPYNKDTMINTRQPIQGITYHSGYRAAYDSVKAIGGNIPDGLTYDMGIMDIAFSDTDKDGQPEMAFTLDKTPESAWGDEDMRVTPPAFSMIPSRTVRKQHKKAKHNKRHGNPSMIAGW